MMKSRIVNQSPKVTRHETQLESFINIVLKAGHVNTVLPFLISNEIPFALSSSGETTESNGSPNEGPSMAIDGPSLGEVENSVIQQRQKSRNKKNDTLIENLFRKYIIKGIENIPPNTEDIAKEAGLSLSQFKALFKKRFGKSFYQIYIEHKMAYAAKLLREGYTSVVVSERIGYVHPIKFNKMFQKYYGMTPYKYQKSQLVK